MGSAASITSESINHQLDNLTDAQLQAIVEILNKGPSKNRLSILGLLAELSAYDANQSAIVSKNNKFLSTLLAVLRGTAEEKLKSLTVFANTSALKENKRTMLSPGFGLIDPLLESLVGGAAAEHELIFTCLRNLCTERSNLEILLEPERKLIHTIVTEFAPADTEAYALAISLLLDIAENAAGALFTPAHCEVLLPYITAGLTARMPNVSKCRTILLNFYYCMASFSSPATPCVTNGLPVLVQVLSDANEESDVLCTLKTIEHLVSKVESGDCFFPSKQSALIAAIQDVTKTNNHDIFLHAANILYQLSEWAMHVKYMCDADVTLIPFLVQEVRANTWKETGDECLIALLMTLINISIPEANKAPMAAPELGLVLAAKDVVLKNKGLVRLLSLKILMDLSESPENVEYMATSDVDLFLVLMEIVFQFEVEEVESIACCLEIIQNLLNSKANKSYVSSLQLGIMKLMMAVIDRDVGDPTRIALRIIYNISLDLDGVVFVAAALRLGLHEKLASIIRKNDESSPQATISWACLSSISKNAEHVEFLVDQELFLKLLVDTLGGADVAESVRLTVLSVVRNLVKDVELVPKVAVPKNGIHSLNALMKEVKEKRAGYIDCLRIILYISKCRTVLEFMASPELGLLHLLTLDLANTGHVLIDGDAREIILEIVVNLSNSHANVEHMLSSEADLYKVLLAVIRDDRSAGEVVLALRTIQQFSLLTKNAILMASVQFGLLKRLLTIIRDQRDERSKAALGVLSNLSAVPETVETMGSEEAGQIVLFSDILRTVYEVDVIVDVLKVLKSLSAHSTSNKIYMASPTHGLVSVILEILQRETIADVAENALKILRNLSGASKNQALLASPETGMVSPLINLIQNDTSDSRTVALAVFRNLTYDKSVSLSLIQPEIKLVSLLNNILNENQVSDCAVNSLSALQNLSAFSENIDILANPDSGVLAVLLKVIRSNRVESKSLGFRVLRNLCSSTKHAERLVSADTSVLTVLFAIINEGRDVDVVQCLQILAVLTKQESILVFLASADVGLLRLLLDTVRADLSDARGLALSCLGNLSRTPENLETFCDVALGILPLLADVLRDCLAKMARSSDSKLRGEIREAQLVIWNMSSVDAIKMALVTSPDLGFLKLLIDYLKQPVMDENKLLTLRIFRSLTMISQIKSSFGSPESGLVELLRDTLLVNVSTTPTEVTPEIVNQTLAVLQNISTVRKNMPYLGSEGVGLVVVLHSSLNKPKFSDDDGKKSIVLSIFQNISCVDETVSYLSSDQVGLLTSLFKIVTDPDSSADERSLSLGVIRNMSTSAENMKRLCSPLFGLHSILGKVLCEGTTKERLNALVILQNVTCAEENILAIGRPESHLVPLLMREVANMDAEQKDLVVTALDVLRNLSSMSANIEYLISSPLNVLDGMIEVIQRDGDTAETSLNALGALCNFADEHVVVDQLLEKRVHSLAIGILSKNKDLFATTSWGEDETLPINALIYLMNMSQWIECGKVFEEEGVITLLQNYITFDCGEDRSPTANSHVLRAFLTVLFLSRDKEETFYWDLLTSGTLKLDDIVSFLESMMKGDIPPECENMHVKTLLRASTCLCLNVSNLATYATPRMVELYISVLKAHQANPRSPRADELRIDIDCAEIAVQGLVSLSLKYADDNVLQQDLFLPHVQDELCPMLTSFNERIQKIEYKQYSLYLLYRLRGREGIGYAKPFSNQKHVMLSYNLDKATKNELISSLQSSLTELGYEVWTETLGSLIAPEVSDKSLENQVARIMALKTSALVVVCVSRLYKQSVLSRMDVSMASDTSGCRFVYALMESDYGVDTSPEVIDGWLLAAMKEFPAPTVRLWLSSHVPTAATSIAEFLGDNTARREALMNGNRGAFRSGGPGIVTMEASILGLSDDQVAKYNTAWEILQTSTNAVDYRVLSTYLDNIGVYDALDLRQCDEDDIVEISKLLKKIQRKVFRTCVVVDDN